MNTTTASLKVSGILRQAACILSANFLFFVGLALLPQLVDLASSMASVHPDPWAPSSSFHTLLVVLSYSLSFVLWVIDLIAQVYCVGAICLTTAHILKEKKISIRSALSAVNPKAIRIIWIFLIQAVLIVLPLFIALILARVIVSQTTILNESNSWISLVIVFIFGGIPTCFLFLRYVLAPSACMIEDISAYSSIERSVDLGRGNRWKIFCAAAIPPIPAFALSFVLQWEIEQHLSGFLFFVRYPVAFHALDKLPDFLIQLVFTPFFYIVVTLLYLQLVEQQEGVSCNELLNGALKTKPYDDEEPGPWDDAPYIEPGPGDSSVGIPWSIYGSQDALQQIQEETDILEAESWKEIKETDSSQPNDSEESQA
jgi:hypothetical protein